MAGRIRTAPLAIICISLSSAVWAQCPDPNDSGECDTVALVVTVDTVGLKAKAELYVYSDTNIIAGSTGFSWNTYPEGLLIMDSAGVSPVTLNGFHYVFLYENNNVDITNVNRRFLFAGGLLSSADPQGVPGDADGRRLWATWYFHLSEWTGPFHWLGFDTLTYDAATDYKYLEGTLTDYRTHGQNVWAGATYVYGSSCCVHRGNVDGRIEPWGPVDIADVVYLAAYLFADGPPPPCLEEGNVNGAVEGTLPITVADQTYLVDYLFSAGPEPPPCW